MIGFSGHAGVPQDGALLPSALSWSVLMHHCTTPSDCHSHEIQTVDGAASGSFPAPGPPVLLLA